MVDWRDPAGEQRGDRRRVSRRGSCPGVAAGADDDAGRQERARPPHRPARRLPHRRARIRRRVDRVGADAGALAGSAARVVPLLHRRRVLMFFRCVLRRRVSRARAVRAAVLAEGARGLDPPRQRPLRRSARRPRCVDRHRLRFAGSGGVVPLSGGAANGRLAIAFGLAAVDGADIGDRWRARAADVSLRLLAAQRPVRHLHHGGASPPHPLDVARRAGLDGGGGPALRRDVTHRRGSRTLLALQHVIDRRRCPCARAFRPAGVHHARGLGQLRRPPRSSRSTRHARTSARACCPPRRSRSSDWPAGVTRPDTDRDEADNLLEGYDAVATPVGRCRSTGSRRRAARSARPSVR